MATRTLPSDRDRRMTILLTPFMSCTAKIPIYAFFVNAFFPGRGGLIMTGLYVLGILTGILAAFLYKGTLFRGEAVPFVMELPNYRLPGLRNTLQLLWEKARDFLQRAFSVILIATILIWFLQNFNLHLNMVDNSAESILAMVSGLLVPLFKPIGLGDWRICTSLISGFMAKESVVATLQVLYGGAAAGAAADLRAAGLPDAGAVRAGDRRGPDLRLRRAGGGLRRARAAVRRAHSRADQHHLRRGGAEVTGIYGGCAERNGFATTGNECVANGGGEMGTNLQKPAAAGFSGVKYDKI
jgi:Fe2+ transport system protein B